MNVIPAAGGCPWTVIPVDKRTDYMNTFESASVKQDIEHSQLASVISFFIGSQIIWYRSAPVTHQVQGACVLCIIYVM